MTNSYDSGRLDLPFVGVATFGKRPLVTDWAAIDAEVAVLGAPFDAGTQWRSGARFGPRAVREASTLFSFGHAGAYDHEDDRVYLPGEVRIVDVGDADIVHTDTEASHANIVPSRGKNHFISCRSTRILISSTNATACAMGMATRCGGRRSGLTSAA